MLEFFCISHIFLYFFKIIFEKIIKYTRNRKKFQHLPLSFYSTPFECFKTVFTFYVAPTKKKYALSEVFFPLLGGVKSQQPGEKNNAISKA